MIEPRIPKQVVNVVPIFSHMLQYASLLEIRFLNSDRKSDGTFACLASAQWTRLFTHAMASLPSPFCQSDVAFRGVISKFCSGSVISFGKLNQKKNRSSLVWCS